MQISAQTNINLLLIERILADIFFLSAGIYRVMAINVTRKGRVGRAA